MEGLNSFIDNAGCIGRNFTAWLEDPEAPGEVAYGTYTAMAGRFFTCMGNPSW